MSSMGTWMNDSVMAGMKKAGFRIPVYSDHAAVDFVDGIHFSVQ